MQSYEHHIVHESLEMRHPYLQDPFSPDIDPTQVSQQNDALTLVAIWKMYRLLLQSSIE